MDPTYPLFPMFSFMGFLLSLIPLSWHLQAWNAGTCAYMLWTSLACLIQFVNAIVWKDNALNVAPIWCDISSKIILGAGVGIPASSMCISRRLYNIATIQTVSVTRQDKRRAVIGDICIAVGIPLLVMVLHYIVQGHRFDVLEQIGCYPYVFNTLPAYFLVLAWPLLLGCTSFVYSVLTLRSFWKRRMQFAELISSNTSLSVSRYMRLMLLAVIEMGATIPFTIFAIYMDTTGNAIHPWVSWEDTHFNFSHVDQIPAVLWKSVPPVKTAVEVTRWMYPACGVLFFLLFGFANEAQKCYALVFWWIAGRFGFKPQQPARQDPLLLPYVRAKAPKSCTSGSPPPAYSPASPFERKSQSDSFTSSLSGMKQHFDVDVEKATSLHSRSSPLSQDMSELRTSFAVSNLTAESSTSESSDFTVVGDSNGGCGSSAHVCPSNRYPVYHSPTLRPPSPAPSREGRSVPLNHRLFYS